MTVTTASIPDYARPTTPTAPRAIPRVPITRDWITWIIAVAILLVTYLALQNPFWVPGGDSEVYTAIARNLATGKGYTFNGQPVSMVPPGWPATLALFMKMSPTFMLLKLVTMSCMLGSFAIMYWVCRRFASPTVCALVIVTSGVLSHVYQLTFWLHSDALFCLVSSAALLIAMQIAEKRPHAWRIPVLIALCSLSVMVRWAGLGTWIIVAAALVDGQLIPRVNRYWITLFLSGVAAAGTFLVVRAALTVSSEAAAEIRKFGGLGEGNEAPVANADKNLATTYELFNPAAGGIQGQIGRVVGWGKWFSYLLWQPMRLGQSNALIGLVSLILGWAILIPLLVQGWRAARSMQWIWVAILFYSCALALNWPRANARYLVPIAPLLVLGVFKFFQIVRERFPTRGAANVSNVLLGYFIASILICNGALYGCDVWAAHSANFYEAYEAGLNRDLIYAAHWLNEHPPKDGQIALCEKYVNLGRVSFSRMGLRATTMLTGKAIVATPRRYTRNGDPRSNPYFLAWARSPEIGVKYVLFQADVSPWRLFHFRVPWLQEAMTGEPAVDTGAGWRLYEIPPSGDECIRVSVPPAPNWPTRVPGM